jgi:hypothetical protein
VIAGILSREGVYSPKQLAKVLGVGPQSIFRPIQRGELRAAKLNDRGDLRILGAWAIAWLESKAETPARG